MGISRGDTSGAGPDLYLLALNRRAAQDGLSYRGILFRRGMDDWVQGLGIPVGPAAQQGQGPGVLSRLQELPPGTHMQCSLSRLPVGRALTLQ